MISTDLKIETLRKARAVGWIKVSSHTLQRIADDDSAPPKSTPPLLAGMCTVSA
jgi:hypothetical protein